MNLHAYNQKNGKKYTAKPVKTEASGETGGRTREEFSRGFIKAYDGALKRIMRGERGKPLSGLLDELEEYVAAEAKNERG